MGPSWRSAQRCRPGSRYWLRLAVAGAVACGDPGRVDPAALQHTPAGPRLRVTILGDPADPRLVPVREAIAHWNRELGRLGRRVRLDSGTVRRNPVPGEVLRAAGGEVLFGMGPATARLRAALSAVPGDIVVALSLADLISYGIPWRAASPGIVVVRRSDLPPLSLPNTVRNVVAHELGHTLGLVHNGDATTLMCGRPAPCRPVAFASDSAYFFRLTAADEDRLRNRWP